MIHPIFGISVFQYLRYHHQHLLHTTNVFKKYLKKNFKANHCVHSTGIVIDVTSKMTRVIEYLDSTIKS